MSSSSFEAKLPAPSCLRHCRRLRLAGEVPKALEEQRTETEYQLAVRSPRLPRPPTQKIVNRLSDRIGKSFCGDLFARDVFAILKILYNYVLDSLNLRS